MSVASSGYLDRSVTSKQLGAISAFNCAMFLEEAMLEIEVCKTLWEMSGKWATWPLAKSQLGK